jgi:hypothetical protein
VVKVLEKRAYRLELLKALAIHSVFHMSQLRKYKDIKKFSERLKKEVNMNYTKKNKKMQIVEVREKRVKKEIM